MEDFGAREWSYEVEIKRPTFFRYVLRLFLEIITFFNLLEMLMSTESLQNATVIKWMLEKVHTNWPEKKK